MGSTLGACGDVNRNVMGPPAPYKNRPEYDVAIQMAHDIADLFAPQVCGCLLTPPSQTAMFR